MIDDHLKQHNEYKTLYYKDYSLSNNIRISLKIRNRVSDQAEISHKWKIIIDIEMKTIRK